MKIDETQAAFDAAAEHHRATAARRADLQALRSRLTADLATAQAQAQARVEAMLTGGKVPAPGPVETVARDLAALAELLTASDAATAQARADMDNAHDRLERAKVAERQEQARAALAAVGITIEGRTASEVRLAFAAGFEASDLADVARLADLVQASGSWPWGRDKALGTITKAATYAA